MKKKHITRQQTFLDYEGFVEKFHQELPKTTDDCYTPDAVYNVVRDYAVERFGLQGRRIVRPFWPGADYQAFEYCERDVVIDNPPFSIGAEIIDFYLLNNIDFFLFVPGLSPGSAIKRGISLVIIYSSITYENGAQVSTAFATNLDKENAFVCDGVLSEKIKVCQPKQVKNENIIYKNHPNVYNAARLRRIARAGVIFRVPFKETKVVRQIGKGVNIFGSGWVISSPAALAASNAAALAASNAAALAATKDAMGIPIDLTPEELKVIENLSNNQSDGFNYFEY